MSITASNLKGALLEYIVRRIFLNCGFTIVKPDHIYTFNKGYAIYVNGKGAAHEMDVLMDPPVQMPFTYPIRIAFECKAYSKGVGLSIVRNALGLRHDINEFEIVTIDSIKKRINNKRASYAVETRKRFLYQVGVASVNEFSKPAIEFAANNKIPLLSLSWFLGPNPIRDFNSIDKSFIASIKDNQAVNLYNFLKDPIGNLNDIEYSRTLQLLQLDNIVGDVITTANVKINYAFIGLIETGDMLFLYSLDESQYNLVIEKAGMDLTGEINYGIKKNIWRLKIYPSHNPEVHTELEFYIPKMIFNYWSEFNYDKSAVLDIKEEYFSKIFLFNKKKNQKLPFTVISINKKWLEEARNELDN